MYCTNLFSKDLLLSLFNQQNTVSFYKIQWFSILLNEEKILHQCKIEVFSHSSMVDNEEK